MVGTISQELEIPASTLSHHLDKLKNEELVNVRRDGTLLWYRVNCDSLEELLGSLCRVLQAQPGRRAPQNRCQ